MGLEDGDGRFVCTEVLRYFFLVDAIGDLSLKSDFHLRANASKVT